MEPPQRVASMDAAFWDEKYRSRGDAWDGEPNAQLIAEAADLVPGRALDAGTGDGGDAIWLAQRGWTATAVDISTVALQRAAGGARAAGDAVAQRITWQQADLTAWAPPEAAFDLVSAHFVHVPAPERDVLHRRLAAAVAPGGTLLVVAHHPSDLDTNVRRPKPRELLFTADDIAAVLDSAQWQIVAREARPRGAVDPDGNAVTIHDSLVRARRLPATR